VPDASPVSGDARRLPPGSRLEEQVPDIGDHEINRLRHDEGLMAALHRALHPDVKVPERFLEMADSCYTWRLIDSELATLAYDSANDLETAVTIRSESAPLRALTYEACDLTFELELMPEGLAGQLIPAQAGELEIQFVDGRTTPVQANSFGYFLISPIPKIPFRLRCQCSDERIVSTPTIHI
jgi:hypothetical protein